MWRHQGQSTDDKLHCCLLALSAQAEIHIQGKHRQVTAAEWDPVSHSLQAAKWGISQEVNKAHGFSHGGRMPSEAAVLSVQSQVLCRLPACV